MEDAIYISYPRGRVGRVGAPLVDGVEQYIAWLAERHPKLIFFWAPDGSVEVS